MKFEIKQSEKTGKYHFNLKAGNGQIILSSQSYATKRTCEKGIASVQKNAADESKYVRKEASNGKPYFVLRAGNHQVIGKSQFYSGKSGLESGIESVMKNGPKAEIE